MPQAREPFQFGLRRLFAVTALCALLAALHPLAAIGLVLVTAFLVVLTFGTAWFAKSITEESDDRATDA